jgi:hypothetical protein
VSEGRGERFGEVARRRSAGWRRADARSQPARAAGRQACASAPFNSSSAARPGRGSASSARRPACAWPGSCWSTRRRCGSASVGRERSASSPAS